MTFARRLLRVSVLLVAVGVCTPSAAWSADASEQHAWSASLLDRWQQWQRPSGGIHEPLLGREDVRYSHAVLGYAWLVQGVRDHDEASIDAGLAAVSWVTRRPWPPSQTTKALSGYRWPSVFENASMAAAYNVARAHLTGDPRFERIRGRWEAMLCEVVPIYLARPVVKAHNKLTVEALSWVELMATGLHSPVRGAVLADPRAAASRLVDLLGTELPHRMRATTTGSGVSALTLLSDEPEQPLAYVALTAAYLQRIVDRDPTGMLAPLAEPLVARVARGLRALTAPDGDIAFVGRSQEQGWALPMAAYAILGSSQQPVAAQVAASLWRRQVRAHPLGATGAAIVPSESRGYGKRAIDRYANASSYNGLMLVATEWLAEAVADRPHPLQYVAAARPQVLMPWPGGLGTVSDGRVWMAVRGASDHEGTDARYDGGLLLLKARQADGRWSDLLPHRPRTNAHMGPVLLYRGHERLVQGRVVRTAGTPDGLAVVGRWASETAPATTSHGAPGRVEWHLRAQGAEMRVPVRAGQVYRFTWWWRQSPRRLGAWIGDDRTRISSNQRLRPVAARTTVNSVQGRIHQVTYHVQVRTTGTWHLVVRGR